MKLDNRGFTLIEVIAVVVILSILMAIMVPSVNHLIIKNKESNYVSFKDGLKQAAKVYLSDHRYEVSIQGACSNASERKNILKIAGNTLVDSKVPIRVLVEDKDLSTDKDGKIRDPRNSEKLLNLDSSYVKVYYECKSRDFSYEVSDVGLIWE